MTEGCASPSSAWNPPGGFAPISALYPPYILPTSSLHPQFPRIDCDNRRGRPGDDDGTSGVGDLGMPQGALMKNGRARYANPRRPPRDGAYPG